jgi:hypothetical protein
MRPSQARILELMRDTGMPLVVSAIMKKVRIYRGQYPRSSRTYRLAFPTWSQDRTAYRASVAGVSVSAAAAYALLTQRLISRPERRWIVRARFTLARKESQQ